MAEVLCVPAQRTTGILPTPQKAEFGKGFLSGEALGHVVYRATDDLPAGADKDQAYRIEITPDGAAISYMGPQGREYGRQTYEMLRLYWNDSIPCMTITDYPALAWRGWLDDISRGPIPHEQFRIRQQRVLECFKMNFYNYYTEHTFYNPRYPDVSPSDGLHASSSIMANLQCLAHFEKTLRIPFYEPLSDTRYNVNPGSEETYGFLEDQIRNVLRNTPNARFFNINCDETEGLGTGRARSYVEGLGAQEAYCQHIRRVHDIVRSAGGDSLQVLMWGDIVGKNPEMLPHLPEDMHYIVWSYVAQDSYQTMLEPFVKAGHPFWVAPGVSHWSGIPQVENYIKNIACLVRDGWHNGALGMMNTSWDDSGESLFSDTWHAMLWSAEMAWNPIRSTDPEEAGREIAVRRSVFDSCFNFWYARLLLGRVRSDRDYASMISRVGALASDPRVADWADTRALMQPLMEFYPSNTDSLMLQRCLSVESLTDSLLAEIDSAALPHYAYLLHRLRCTAEKCRLRVLLYRRDPSAEGLARIYLRHLHQLKLEYLRIWDEECSQYSRDLICERYDNLGREVLELDRKVMIHTRQDRGLCLCMETLVGHNPIYYTLDGRIPTAGSCRYSEPVPISHSCLVRAVCYNEYGEPVYSEKYVLCHKGMGCLHHLNTAYSTYKDTYSGGGEAALCDGELGSDHDYSDGHWQGYWGNDIDAVLDFGRITDIHTVSMRFLQNTFDWILAPNEIEIFASRDGNNWKPVRKQHFDPEFRQGGPVVRTDTFSDLDLSTRYLRVVAHNPGPLPEWHPAKGWDSYLFIDEIVVE